MVRGRQVSHSFKIGTMKKFLALALLLLAFASTAEVLNIEWGLKGKELQSTSKKNLLSL